jgi:hypothetical protein
MRKRGLAIFLLAIFALLVAAWFFLPQTNTSTPQTNETVQAKITAFTADTSWSRKNFARSVENFSFAIDKGLVKFKVCR